MTLEPKGAALKVVGKSFWPTGGAVSNGYAATAGRPQTPSGWVVAGVQAQGNPTRRSLGGRSRHQPKPILPLRKEPATALQFRPTSGTNFMAKDPEPIVINCGSCGARYMTQATGSNLPLSFIAAAACVSRLTRML